MAFCRKSISLSEVSSRVEQSNMERSVETLTAMYVVCSTFALYYTCSQTVHVYTSITSGVVCKALVIIVIPKKSGVIPYPLLSHLGTGLGS